MTATAHGLTTAVRQRRFMLALGYDSCCIIPRGFFQSYEIFKAVGWLHFMYIMSFQSKATNDDYERLNTGYWLSWVLGGHMVTSWKKQSGSILPSSLDINIIFKSQMKRFWCLTNEVALWLSSNEFTGFFRHIAWYINQFIGINYN